MLIEDKCSDNVDASVAFDFTYDSKSKPAKVNFSYQLIFCVCNFVMNITCFVFVVVNWTNDLSLYDRQTQLSEKIETISDFMRNFIDIRQ